MLVMLLISMAAVVVRPPTIIRRSVVWITTVVAVIAARVITIPISWVSIVTVTISGITEADSDSSDPD